MKEMPASDHAEILRFLPSIDALIHTRTAVEILSVAGAKHLTIAARAAIDDLRGELQKNIIEKSSELLNYSRESLLSEAENRLADVWRAEQNSKLRRVINATGVVIHTNLGRAPLSEKARQAVIENAAGYCTLEYDLETGKRGRRGARVEKLLAEITGAEAGIVVNNCAAAAFLVLTALARDGEVVISRGEMVEIGGDFRVPDVMEQSGATLKEVGATNRTHLADYENAVSEQTRMFLKVHPSNYRIVGFTSAPDLSELAALARRKNVLLCEDAGSGAIFDLREYGLTDEPIIADSIRAGADIVTFSGDKLLGGAQSGLIVGRRELIAKLRKHPLYRALRVDKIIYAALEATLESFRRETALEEIPVLKMLSATSEEIKIRAVKFAQILRRKAGKTFDLEIEIAAGNSVIGGGSAPLIQPVTSVIALKHKKISSANLEEKLRRSNPPIIARIVDDKVLIDLRTVSEAEELELSEILSKF